MTSRIDRKLAHELDASWIIALFKAIHGGDPSPDQQTVHLSEKTVEMVAALTEHLRETGVVRQTQALTLATLQERLKPFGIEVMEGETAPAKEELRAARFGTPDEPQHQPPWCFVFHGQRICINRPRVTHTVQ
jgi:hypothetical protein